jgi:hypothetical protein
MQSELYADGIGEITVTGMIVRIDLVSLSPTERDASNAPKPVIRQRVIMSVEGFANSVDLMQKALQGLIDGGAIRRTPVPQSNAPEPAGDGRSSRQHSSMGQNGSPNFS